MNAQILYAVLFAVGLSLILLEMFLPGMILGILGVCALLGAIYVGYVNFAAPWNWLSSLGVVICSSIFFMLWFHIFPKTRISKRVSLQTDAAAFKASAHSNSQWLNQTGETITALRPAGIMMLGSKRLDVVAAGGEWLPVGTRVRVIAINGAVITVAPAEEAEEKSAANSPS